jgi:ATP-dependent DNA ligase
MGKLLNRLFGMLMPEATSHRDTPAAATPPRLIAGAHTAPQLCMLPVDHDSVAGVAALERALPPGKRLVQLKADGIRALYVDGRVVSREGAPLDCALHCQPGLARIEQAVGRPMMIDGEYVAQNGFDATLTEMKRGQGEGVFWAFDMMPLADWQAGSCGLPIEHRLQCLRERVVACDSQFVGMLDWWMMTPHQTAAKAREIWAAGGEGVVSKQPGSPYLRQRSDFWVRFKEVHTLDSRIVDVIARPDGTLRRLIVKPERGGESSTQPIVIGTGWSAADGRRIVDAFNAGQISGETWAEISFQLTTGARRTVRGARFHRLRDPKGVQA